MQENYNYLKLHFVAGYIGGLYSCLESILEIVIKDTNQHGFIELQELRKDTKKLLNEVIETADKIKMNILQFNEELCQEYVHTCLTCYEQFDLQMEKLHGTQFWNDANIQETIEIIVSIDRNKIKANLNPTDH
jgi:hypothetical protein